MQSWVRHFLGANDRYESCRSRERAWGGGRGRLCFLGAAEPSEDLRSDELWLRTMPVLGGGVEEGRNKHVPLNI